MADDATPEETWGLVEIFGHRRHYGRVREVEKFGTVMLCVDVPGTDHRPLLDGEEKFDTFLYGGAAIFSFTPMTEEAARKWADNERPRPYKPLDRLPAPDYGEEAVYGVEERGERAPPPFDDPIPL
jgi:hypothetical protein